MFRLYLLLSLFFFTLHACKGSANSCVQKVIDANAIQGATLSLPVKSNKRLLYSLTTPNAKIYKHDPFLGLYLVEDRSGFAYDFEFDTKRHLPGAVVDRRSYAQGVITKHQSGLSELGTFSRPHTTPALLLNSCCYLFGLVTPNGIIGRPYLEHFLSSRGGVYGDIGLRFEQQASKIVVSAKDPFFAYSAIQQGDEIVLLDGKRYPNAQALTQKVLFSSPGSRHTLRVKRGSKIFDVSVVTQRRHGGGLLSDTFLESKGLRFRKDLSIESITGEMVSYGLKRSDKLLWVNGVSVKTQKELRAALSRSGEDSTLLFERDNFQFFVNLK